MLHSSKHLAIVHRPDGTVRVADKTKVWKTVLTDVTAVVADVNIANVLFLSPIGDTLYTEGEYIKVNYTNLACLPLHPTDILMIPPSNPIAINDSYFLVRLLDGRHVALRYYVVMNQACLTGAYVLPQLCCVARGWNRSFIVLSGSHIYCDDSLLYTLPFLAHDLNIAGDGSYMVQSGEFLFQVAPGGAWRPVGQMDMARYGSHFGITTHQQIYKWPGRCVGFLPEGVNDAMIFPGSHKRVFTVAEQILKKRVFKQTV